MELWGELKMEPQTTNIIYSINNVRHLINNSILILRDFDTVLSKHGFQPIFGNAIGTESSKSITQSMSGYRTFFPQFMARQYALESDMDENKVKKILFINIQFFHGDYTEIPPMLTCSVTVLPDIPTNYKNDVQNWWLKNTMYEAMEYENVRKNGEINEHYDEEGYKTVFWCKDLLTVNGQNDINEMVERLVQTYNSEE